MNNLYLHVRCRLILFGDQRQEHCISKTVKNVFNPTLNHILKTGIYNHISDLKLQLFEMVTILIQQFKKIIYNFEKLLHTFTHPVTKC